MLLPKHLLSATLLLLSHLAPLACALNSTGLTTAVQWDPYSLLIQGQRVFVLSAEIHPWRNLNPSLWRDIFDKVKDNGFNAVSFYTHWGLHYPSAGVNGGKGDFTAGTNRELQLFIDEAKNAGLWLIARPGPYVNGETTGGGIPGWASNNAGALRTNAADYTAAWTPYVTQMAKLIAANQVTAGGPIVLVQSENEFSRGSTHDSYMQALENTYRANGVVIPFTHNDQHSGQAGNFSPDTDTTPGDGAVNIYCADSYPQGSTSWSNVQTIYRTYHETNSYDNPLCLAEFGGGYQIPWGGVAMGGTGYEAKYTNNLVNSDYENVFYKDTYAQTTKLLNIYMLFGGTNWGNTATPIVYTSYDFGGGINENRILTAKMAEMRLQGSFLRVSRELFNADYTGSGTNYTTSTELLTQVLRNGHSNAGFYFVRHSVSSSTDVTTTQLHVTTSIGSLTIPTTGSMTIQGRELKIIVTDYVFGQSNTRMVYSTSEVMTWTTIASVDYIVVYAMAGQSGESALQFAQQPTVNLQGFSNIKSSWNAGVLTLDYTFTAGQASFVKLTVGSTNVVVAIMEKSVARNWHAALLPGSSNFGNYFSIGTNSTVLVGGPYLVRGAQVNGGQLALTGDLNGTTTIEVVPPTGVTQFSWNGAIVTASRTAYGTLKGSVQGLQAPVLPNLGPWKVMGALPEASASFDDSQFTTANQLTTNFTALPPLTAGPVLYSQQYGFFGGMQLYRGHFTGTGKETAINATVQGGVAFGYSAYLNGVFLGSNPGTPTASLASNLWTIPKGVVKVSADNVFAVVMDHMGLVETNTNSGKEPRGIRGVTIVGGPSFSSWKIQGNLGGNTKNPDTFRGYLNEGGLYPERIGAHLPGFDDSTWQTTNTLSVASAGINFFRTTFSLALPGGTNSDVPIRLSFTPSASTKNYRVQIYINGWMLGKYVNNIGPQTIFVLPSGIINRNSVNTLALSLWSQDAAGAQATVGLISDGTFSSSFSFADFTTAPNYAAQKTLRPSPVFYAPM